MTILCSEANNLETFIGKLHNIKPNIFKSFYCISTKPYKIAFLWVVEIPFLWYLKLLV